MFTENVNIFNSLDRGTREALASLEYPLLRCLGALFIAKQRGGARHFSAREIQKGLKMAGVSISLTSIISALRRAGERIHTERDTSGEVQYELMIAGEREVEEKLGGNIDLIRITGEGPWRARARLSASLSDLEGVVRICDPYFGLRSLDSIWLIPPVTGIRFLTSRTSEDRSRFIRELHDLRKERPELKVRICEGKELHDRYIVTKKRFILLGHGIKDIGNKESFIISIDKSLAENLISDAIQAFDSRWQKCKDI